MINAKLERLIIVYGHYGCGKTNFSINLALDFAEKGEKVTLVDLDIVNPYFRSSDYKSFLSEKGIEVIAPKFAGSNLDTPSLSAEIYKVFDSNNRVIFDVGGDDAGAYALGRFASKIKECGYTALYVINKFRGFISTPTLANGVLKEIETACGIKADAIINNSHLQHSTTAEDILSSLEYGEDTSKLLNLPIMAVTVPRHIADNEKIKGISNIYPVDIIVKPPFN